MKKITKKALKIFNALPEKRQAYLSGIALYYGEGHSLRETASKFNVSAQCVHYNIRTYFPYLMRDKRPTNNSKNKVLVRRLAA